MIRHWRREGDTSRLLSRARAWAVWSVPAPALAFLLTTEVCAGFATIALLRSSSATVTVVARFCLLAILAVGYSEVARRSSRMQRYLGVDKIITTPKSVWSYAALLTLPLGWACLFVVVQYVHQLWQRRRDATGASYRVVFTAATVIVAQLAAGCVLNAGHRIDYAHSHAFSSAAALLGIPVYVAVNILVLVAGMWLTVRPPSIRALIWDPDSLSFEVGTLVLGLATAEFLLRSPVLTPAVLVLVALLHRSTVVKALQKTATTDAKTGLLTAAAWRDSATTTLQRAARAGSGAAVLIVDLDHFKAVNDTHGHLTGDRVLAAVSGCLRRELRGYDGVGRFGGEELVAILDGVSRVQTEAIAHRLRAAIAALRIEDAPSVTASIGLAHTDAAPVDADLDRFLERADRALYAAKAAGRDRVRLAPGLG